MSKLEKANKYGKFIVADTLVLVVFSVISLLNNFLFGLVFIVLETIILVGYKKMKLITKTNGFVALILGLLLMIISFLSSSIIVLLLSIIYVVHSILFLLCADERYVEQYCFKEKRKSK